MRTARFHKKKYSLVIIVVIIFAILAVVLVFKRLKVSKVDIKFAGESCVSVEQVENGVNLINQNIFSIDQSQVQKQIQNKFTCVKSVTLNKKFPNTAVLTLTSRVPVAKVVSFKQENNLNLNNLNSPEASQTALVNLPFPQAPGPQDGLFMDSEGITFTQTSNTQPLPVIFVPLDSVKQGKYLNLANYDRINKVFTKIIQTPEYSFKISLQSPTLEGKLVDNWLVLNTKPYLIFDLDSDVDRQLASLQLILQKSKINEENMRVLDLRFDKPVVTYDHPS